MGAAGTGAGTGTGTGTGGASPPVKHASSGGCALGGESRGTATLLALAGAMTLAARRRSRRLGRRDG
jgi:hypothetical protein